jgi:hypothetical protein
MYGERFAVEVEKSCICDVQHQDLMIQVVIQQLKGVKNISYTTIRQEMQSESVMLASKLDKGKCPMDGPDHSISTACLNCLIPLVDSSLDDFYIIHRDSKFHLPELTILVLMEITQLSGFKNETLSLKCT